MNAADTDCALLHALGSIQGHRSRIAVMDGVICTLQARVATLEEHVEQQQEVVTLLVQQNSTLQQLVGAHDQLAEAEGTHRKQVAALHKARGKLRKAEKVCSQYLLMLDRAFGKLQAFGLAAFS